MKQTVFAVMVTAMLSGCASGPKFPPPNLDAPLTQLDAIGYLVMDGWLFGSGQLCAATLVAPDEIVTALHCMVRDDKVWKLNRITFRARNRNLSAKVIEVTSALSVHAIKSMELVSNLGGWIRAGQDYVRLRIETPLGETLGTIPVSKPNIQAILDGREFSVAGVPGGKFEIQHGCRLHQEVAKFNDDDAKNYLKASENAEALEYSIAQFGIGKNGPTTRKQLENGAFTHTCSMKPGYSGGPLLERLSGSWALAGVNSSSLAKNKELPEYVIAKMRSRGFESLIKNLMNFGLGEARLAYICREGKECQEDFW